MHRTPHHVTVIPHLVALIACSVFWLLAGCSSNRASGVIHIQPVEIKSENWTAAIHEEWDATLKRVASREGVDYAILAKEIAANERAIFYFSIGAMQGEATVNQIVAALFSSESVQGPENPQETLASGITLYNALILRTILEMPADGQNLSNFSGKFERQYSFKFSLDENAWEARADTTRSWIPWFAIDDWRIQFALCGGRKGDPPLPPRVFTGNDLDRQLDESVKEAWASDQMVKVDHGLKKRLLLAGILYDLQPRLIADYERRLNTKGATILNVLLERSEPLRRYELNSAVGYEVARMPYDRRINAVPAKEPAQQH